jgi:hypothetical protein
VAEAEDAVITMVPTIALPPAMPPTVNVTAVDALPAPLTVAVKTSEPPAGKLLEAGARLTAIVEGVCTGVEDSEGAEVLPHAERNIATAIPGNKTLCLRVKMCAAPEMQNGVCMHTFMRQGVCHCGAETSAAWFFSHATLRRPD